MYIYFVTNRSISSHSVGFSALDEDLLVVLVVVIFVFVTVLLVIAGRYYKSVVKYNQSVKRYGQCPSAISNTA